MFFSVPDTNYPQQYSLFIESVEETHSGVYRAITPGEKKVGGLHARQCNWQSERSHSQVIKIEICDRYMFGTCESY